MGTGERGASRRRSRGPRDAAATPPPRSDLVEHRHDTGESEVFRVRDEDGAEKVFGSIRKNGGVSLTHQKSLVELLQRAGHATVVDATVLGWKHARPGVRTSERAQRAYGRSVARLKGGRKSMAWRGLDRHAENLHRMRNALTVREDG